MIAKKSLDVFFWGIATGEEMIDEFATHDLRLVLPTPDINSVLSVARWFGTG